MFSFLLFINLKYMLILLNQYISGKRNNISSKRSVLSGVLVKYDDVDITYGSKKPKVEGIIPNISNHFLIASNEILITTYQIRQIQ